MPVAVGENGTTNQAQLGNVSIGRYQDAVEDHVVPTRRVSAMVKRSPRVKGS